MHARFSRDVWEDEKAARRPRHIAYKLLWIIITGYKVVGFLGCSADNAVTLTI